MVGYAWSHHVRLGKGARLSGTGGSGAGGPLAG